VLDAEVSIGKLDRQDADRAKKQPLGVLSDPDVPASDCVGVRPGYGFFCAYARDYLRAAGFTAEQLRTGGYRIRTTLDAKLTDAAKQAVDANVPPRTPGIATTMVVVRPGDGGHEVAALVTNREYGVDAAAGQSMTNLPVAVSDPFGAGSVFKLFTTAAAMEQGGSGCAPNCPIRTVSVSCRRSPTRTPSATPCRTTTSATRTRSAWGRRWPPRRTSRSPTWSCGPVCRRC
jgi:membrane peptidoglycan carboxypeptidase